jgi:hypothetical protein
MTFAAKGSRVLCALVLVLGLAACRRGQEEQGPAERAGKAVDDPLRESADRMNEAGKKVGEAAGKAGQEVGKAMEDAGKRLQETPAR